MRLRNLPGYLSGYREPLYAALIVFSAVSLATLEFMKNVFPTAVDMVLVPKTTVVYMIVLVQVLPALVLLAADRLIAARYGSGRRLRVFRSVLFVVAIVLIVRQLQLYWGPAADFTDSVSSSGLVLLVLVDLTFLAALVGIAIWLFRGLSMFFAYMAPVAIVMTAMIPFQVETRGSLPETYSQEVATATGSESQPAVFILVFDELGYDVLLRGGTGWNFPNIGYDVLREQGKLDAESFPNIAALAQDGVWFTNATTNSIDSINVIPAMMDSVIPLAEDFDIRFYTQYLRLEELYMDDCGQVMTCRGSLYLTENDQLGMAGDLALRAFYQATPDWVDSAIIRPMDWLLGRLGWAHPSLHKRGDHLLTKRQFSVFLDDIKGRTALGRIHVLHLLLPHDPFIFNEEGEVQTSWTSYRQQAMFLDILVGEFTSKLKREGIYEDSVIVLTGDHGWRNIPPSPEEPPIQPIPHVPLVIHAPGLASDVSDVDYQHIDFGPTLTDILGLPTPSYDTAEDARRRATRRQQTFPHPPQLLLEPEGFAVSAFSTERPQRDKVFYDFSGNVYVYSEEDGSWHFSRKEE